MADISKININGTEYNIKDTEARNQGPSLPIGGTIGQVLAKNSDTDGDAGWYDLRNLPSDKWYLPDGIVESDVIAAYQFVDRLNEAEALININEGTEYGLSKSGSDVVWSSTNGLFIPAASSAGITNSNIVNNYANVNSVVFGFSNANPTTSKTVGGVILHQSKFLLIGCTTNRSNWYKTFPYPSIPYDSSGKAYVGPDTIHNGVLSSDFVNKKIYVNGTSISLTLAKQNDGTSEPITGLSHYSSKKVFGQDSNSNVLSCYVTAIAFYNTILTNAQHVQLSDNIHALGGIG